MRQLITSVLLLVASSVHAASVTIDFENAQTAGPVVTQAGYSFTYNSSPNYSPVLSSGGNPDRRLFICETGFDSSCPYSTSVRLTATFGGSFDLVSFDISGAQPLTYDTDARLVGFLADGGTVSMSLNTFLSKDDFGNSPSSWTTIILHETWSGLDSVLIDVEVAEVFIDNVTVSAVPVPAAAWLFGSALVGLGWIRRKSFIQTTVHWHAP